MRACTRMSVNYEGTLIYYHQRLAERCHASLAEVARMGHADRSRAHLPSEGAAAARGDETLSACDVARVAAGAARHGLMLERPSRRKGSEGSAAAPLLSYTVKATHHVLIATSSCG